VFMSNFNKRRDCFMLALHFVMSFFVVFVGFVGVVVIGGF